MALKPFSGELDPILPSGSLQPFDGPLDGEDKKKPSAFTETVQRTGGQIASAAGTALEDLGAPDTGQKLREYGEGVIQRHPSQLSGLSDLIEKPGTAIKEAVGNLVPQLPLSLGGAWAGARLGGVFGPVGAGVGGAIGAFAPNLMMEYGETRDKQREEGIDDKTLALKGALPAAGLELVGDAALVGRLLPEPIKKAAGKLMGDAVLPEGAGLGARVGHALKEGGKGALIEGPLTEIPQTYLERFGGGQEVFSPEGHEEALMSGGLGLLGGGAVRGTLGLVAPNRAEPAPTGDTGDAGDTGQTDIVPHAPETPPQNGGELDLSPPQNGGEPGLQSGLQADSQPDLSAQPALPLPQLGFDRTLAPGSSPGQALPPPGGFAGRVWDVTPDGSVTPGPGVEAQPALQRMAELEQWANELEANGQIEAAMTLRAQMSNLWQQAAGQAAPPAGPLARAAATVPAPTPWSEIQAGLQTPATPAPEPATVLPEDPGHLAKRVEMLIATRPQIAEGFRQISLGAPIKDVLAGVIGKRLGADQKAVESVIDELLAPPALPAPAPQAPPGVAGSETATDTETPTTGMDLAKLVKLAQHPKRSGNKAYQIYRAVSETEANRLTELTGIDVRGFQHGMDEAAIRHVLKEHGDPERERARGQIAVTADDFALVPEITDPEQADKIERGQPQADGTQTIRYEKRYNGTTYVIEEVRTGRKRLALKTLWKVRAAPRATSEEGVAHTPETFGAQPPTDELSIRAPEPGEKAAKPAQPTAPEDHTPETQGRIPTRSGEQLYSQSGRALSPAPKIDVSTDDKARNSLQRMNLWLYREALNEAGEELESVIEVINPRRMSRADQDTLNEILFGNPDGPTDEHRRPRSAAGVPPSPQPSPVRGDGAEQVAQPDVRPEPQAEAAGEPVKLTAYEERGGAAARMDTGGLHGRDDTARSVTTPEPSIPQTTPETGAQEKPDYPGLRGLKVDIPVEIADTGEKGSMRVDAAETLQDLDQRLRLAKTLLDCVKGG